MDTTYSSSNWQVACVWLSKRKFYLIPSPAPWQCFSSQQAPNCKRAVFMSNIESDVRIMSPNMRHIIHRQNTWGRMTSWHGTQHHSSIYEINTTRIKIHFKWSTELWSNCFIRWHLVLRLNPVVVYTQATFSGINLKRDLCDKLINNARMQYVKNKF